jgi:hypothetical protein
MKRILLKILRYGFFALVCLATIIALVIAEENFRSKREWESYKREHEARGERLDLQPLIPPPVPDEQNFAMTPLLRPLFPDGKIYAEELQKKLEFPAAKPDAKRPGFGDRASGKRVNLDDWRTYFGGQDVLPVLQKFDPELREISDAVRRPYSRFPVSYEKGLGTSLPHMQVLMNLGKIYTLRAFAESREGQSDASLADVQTVFRLTESVKDEPTLISLLVRIAICQTGLQAAWDGLADRRWSDAQLSVLQDELARADFLTGLQMAFRGERAEFNSTMLQVVGNPKNLPGLMGIGDGKNNTVWQFIPSGWFYQNMLTTNRFYDAVLPSSSDPAALRTLAARYNEAAAKVKVDSVLNFFGIRMLNPYNVLLAIGVPVFSNVTTRAFYAQVSTDEAVIACALERYRLANGQYPDALEKLVPAFLKTVPLDAVSGEPLHYRLKDDGNFLLYSVGADGKDDGGKNVLKKSGSVDITQGDWVWSLKPL